MEIDDIVKYLEIWAPPGASWDKDNPGLQVGNRKQKLKNIFLCLELTPKVLSEAEKHNCNLVISHHPLIFKPLKKLDTQKDEKALLIEQLIKKDIALYSAHTNFDFTKNGVSFELAKTIGLKNICFLENQDGNQYKLVVYVPENAADKISEAIFNAGAGQIGEYEKCSFKTSGTGTFMGSENSNPSIGGKLVLEETAETRIEVLVHSWNLNKVIKEMLKVHPYEEPAYDVFLLKNKNVNFGMGALGTVEKEISADDFLNHVSKKLKTGNLRYSEGKRKKISTVAVCGGSGSELLPSAIRQNADAFITADVKYHTFQDAENKILLIDAGHYETEVPSLNILKSYLEDYITRKGEATKVLKYKGSTNPVKFYNNLGEI